MLKEGYIYHAMIFLVFVLVLATGCSGQQARETNNAAEKNQSQEQLLMASTIGPIDAGIVGVLEEAFEKKTGIKMRHLGAGTGEALKIGQSGNVDLVMVHAKALEEKFVAEGYGTRRIPLMYNDFIIMGPPEDPAQIRGMKSATEALQKIAQSQILFITRGDNSGTHVKEKELWQAAGIKPEGLWYKIYEKGTEGNAKTLKYTDEQKAYTLIDRATYLTLKTEINLQVLVEKDEALLNYITLIPVNPEKFPSAKNELALKFVEFATSQEGQTIIKEFGKEKYGESLFFPNAGDGEKL
ncbi:substrate-binding domain-containing protein [Desulforamulus ruminis]|uniref:ABC-type tungstate transport system, permease component n=1 Tax=Desulforamulus ruminis (strain ATCC 23193 / DSM 2154 / NCIMB 8452 / DL) TaxID=696281 RepID=F6DS44_DESRL|nr:substrate-binding domain-containing protein [Desulforamulus ruminis]AEG58806.1 ABC-type tungstate transport system, permease component [Desulforamulus ruminis DSM 2154]